MFSGQASGGQVMMMMMVGWLLQLGQAGCGLYSRQTILTDSMNGQFGNIASSGSSTTIIAW
jgi:hypothetical protein